MNNTVQKKLKTKNSFQKGDQKNAYYGGLLAGNETYKVTAPNDAAFCRLDQEKIFETELTEVCLLSSDIFFSFPPLKAPWVI